MITCKICNKSYETMKGLSSHIRQTHKISSEDYYLQYIDSDNSCKICGQPTHFKDLTHGFYIYCCYQCMNNDNEKIELQNNTFKSNPTNVERARKHMIQYNQSDIGRQNSSKVGKITGGISFLKGHNEYDGIKWCDICGSETSHIFGVGCMTCYNKSEIHKQNIINGIQKKYGNQYTNAFQVPEIKAKSVQTSLEKYNITNAGNSREARKKANETMRKNGNYSKAEDYFEQKLQELDIIYEKQYSSNKYPFPCDFYIPKIDAYIEINMYWSHGGHWFNKNNEKDIQTLQKWQEKAKQGHKQYQNSIRVWTEKDILKKEIAEQNNLNYIVLWSYKDIDDFINVIYNIYVNQEVEIEDKL